MTSVKRAQEALRELALFPQLNPGPVLRFDREGAILSSNPTALAILGETAKEGSPLASLITGVNTLDLDGCIERGDIISHNAQVGERHFQFVFRGLPDLGIGHVYGSDITDRRLVNADRRRVTQVFNNLLNNAAKFSPSTAPISIDVSHDGVQVTVAVQDRGRGIQEESLRHLFRKFSQIHENGGPKLSGSGLGLAICKGIVEAHGGRIWAESPGLGQGSTFSFTLAVAVQAPTGPAPDTSRSDQHLGRVSRAGVRTRVLAVDDETQVLRFLQRSSVVSLN